MGAVLTKFRNFRNIGFKSFTPVVEYASEIWGHKENIQCESIHQRACRYYMGVHPKTPILALIANMGWPTSQIKDKEI